MRSYKTEGIILRRQNFSEADRILTVFTRTQGKIKILAKGVRRIKSRRGPNVELFNQVTLFLHRGRNFDILTEAQAQNTFPQIRKKLELVGLAYYVCELVDGLCAENQPHPKVFELLVKILNELENNLIRKFELSLLSELGFLPASNAMSNIAGRPTSALVNLNTTFFIEQILERKLKTKSLFQNLF